MKKIITTLLLCMFLKTHTQDFTISQLQEYNKYTVDNFKIDVKKKGFVFYDKTETETFSMYEYTKFENDVSYK